jgi:hypothetical protein
MLLLQQIQEVSSRTDAQQSFDRVEDEIDSPLRCHGPKRLNVAREEIPWLRV